MGLDVVAFDSSPTAVEWARSRHPDTAVDWQVADLFAPPSDWLGSFDLVVDVHRRADALDGDVSCILAELVRLAARAG